MMKNKSLSVYDSLICPNCSVQINISNLECEAVCTKCSSTYPVIDGIPVLINESDSASIFTKEDFSEKRSLFFNLSKKGQLKAKISAAIPNMGGNNLGDKNFKKLAKAIKEGRKGRPRVLMLGASIEGTGTKEFLNDKELEIIESDVSFGPRTQIILDAHNIPYADDSFDAVVAQAVLEHVVSPQQCVEEMHRVLKDNGVVYTEIPFMQQVHGGAYDFTRYTHSGHRYLMRGFKEIDSGATAGAGTAMAWSYEYLLMSLFGVSEKLHEPIKLFARITGSWMRLLDHLATGSRAVLNGCSGTYFIGRKSTETYPVKELRSYYHQQKEKN